MNLDQTYSRISSGLGARLRNRVLFSSVASTNEIGKRMASFYQRQGERSPVTALVALEQTRGRGRLGRSWCSPPGGIYASLVLPIGDSDALAMLPMRTATALCRELDSLLDGPCRLKWPNDLMVEGRKIGGILIEAVGYGTGIAAVAGFGINYSADLPNLAAPFTTMYNESDSDLPPMPDVTVRLLKSLEDGLLQVSNRSDLVSGYSRWSQHEVGDPIVCRTGVGVHRGEFLGFDDRGFLRLRTDVGEQLLSSGEIVEQVDWMQHDA